MSLEIRELNHVMIRVRDLDAAIVFYRDVIGLAVIPRPAFDFAGAWFALGKQELHLVHDPQLSPAARGNHHFAIWVENHAAVVADLRKKGVTSRGPQLRPDGVQQFFVTDPDGYVIEFMSAPPGAQ
jgi:catechol 2,3-dioxygenase-like lactoylglutathione lyase family enzyme